MKSQLLIKNQVHCRLNYQKLRMVFFSSFQLVQDANLTHYHSLTPTMRFRNITIAHSHFPCPPSSLNVTHCCSFSLIITPSTNILLSPPYLVKLTSFILSFVFSFLRSRTWKAWLFVCQFLSKFNSHLITHKAIRCDTTKNRIYKISNFTEYFMYCLYSLVHFVGRLNINVDIGTINLIISLFITFFLYLFIRYHKIQSLKSYTQL